MHFVLRVRFQEALPTTLNQHRHHTRRTCLARTAALRCGAHHAFWPCNAVLIIDVFHKLAITARRWSRRGGPGWSWWGGAWLWSGRRGPPWWGWRCAALMKSAARYPRGHIVGLVRSNIRCLAIAPTWHLGLVHHTSATQWANCHFARWLGGALLYVSHITMRVQYFPDLIWI